MAIRVENGSVGAGPQGCLTSFGMTSGGFGVKRIVQPAARCVYEQWAEGSMQ